MDRIKVAKELVKLAKSLVVANEVKLTYDQIKNAMMTLKECMDKSAYEDGEHLTEQSADQKYKATIDLKHRKENYILKDKKRRDVEIDAESAYFQKTTVEIVGVKTYTSGSHEELAVMKHILRQMVKDSDISESEADDLDSLYCHCNY